MIFLITVYLFMHVVKIASLMTCLDQNRAQVEVLPLSVTIQKLAGVSAYIVHTSSETCVSKHAVLLLYHSLLSH